MTNIEIGQLKREAGIIRQERDEPGFEVYFPGLQVNRDFETGHITEICDGAIQTSLEKCEMTAYFMVRRGKGANIRQTREMATPHLGRLFENLRWKDKNSKST